MSFELPPLGERKGNITMSRHRSVPFNLGGAGDNSGGATCPRLLAASLTLDFDAFGPELHYAAPAAFVPDVTAVPRPLVTGRWNAMLIRVAMRLIGLSPQFRRFLWRRWYEHLAGYQVRDWGFMNYGYSSLKTNDPCLLLQADDEPNRFSVQLYHHVASAVALKGLDVLEVGCGRGGGASFVKRYLAPQRMTGIDFSAKAVRFCRDHHRVEGLSFVCGDAESLPLDDASFDAVINIESSHCYGSMPTFLGQVKRVLRPGGFFLFADLRSAADRDRLHQQILDSGMTLLDQQDITDNVIEALRRDSERKLALIERNVNKCLLNTFRQFAAVEGSETFKGFSNGTFVYVRYLLQK